jgi:hypothetical protein
MALHKPNKITTKANALIATPLKMSPPVKINTLPKLQLEPAFNLLKPENKA